MEKSSKHHVLPPNGQEDNDKAAIRNIIESYDIDDAIHLLYISYQEMHQYPDNIDVIVNKFDRGAKDRDNALASIKDD